MSDERRRQMATEAIHAGEIHDPSGAHIAPIYQTSTFTFDGMSAVEEWAEGETGAYIYSRGGNPARSALARKLAALESYGLGAEAESVTAERWAPWIKRADLHATRPDDVRRVASAEELRSEFQDSVLDCLRKRGKPQPDYARADIRALPADGELAMRLAQPPGTALLLLEAILYSEEGKPMDYSRNYFVPGYFAFHVIRRIGSR